MNKKIFLSTAIITILLAGFVFIPANRAYALQFPTPVNQVQSIDNSKTAGENIQKGSEGQIVMGKFFTTMLWVVGSCGVLFLILLLYKKKFGGINMTASRPISKEQDLTSPSTVDEAVKLFIEKF